MIFSMSLIYCLCRISVDIFCNRLKKNILLFGDIDRLIDEHCKFAINRNPVQGHGSNTS